jgi:AcrR family transcriptional regulator
MVRPRFAKLSPGQQQAIRQAAADEFAAHGFHDASLNRVIEAAGISKGSLYYYFDGKEDLYVYVAQAGLEQLVADLGPFEVPSERDPDAFWSTLEGYYVRLMTALSASPQLAAIIRGWIAAPKSTALQQAQQEAEQAVLPWIDRTLAAGQRAGAVRSDLPAGLLIAVVAGMGQAMDTWLLTQQPEAEDLPRLIGQLIDLMRGALDPKPHR